MSETRISGSCHCQSVNIIVNAKPDYINDCNCSLCSNSGAIWGYYKGDDIIVTGSTITYSRTDRPNPAVQIHSCKICSATTHWTWTETFAAQNKDINPPYDTGINMYLFNDDALTGCELRFPDGKAWDGITSYAYRKDSIIL